MKHPPHVLLINPWITDFAAYDFWVKPLGLLRIGSLLRENGLSVNLIDCLDCHSKKKEFGDGKFHKTGISKPLSLRSIPRNYSRYGIPEEALKERLSSVKKPDIICVTSGMTYWYPGVIKVIEIANEFFKKVPVILGGIYATLCYDHAVQHSGADHVIPGRGESEALRLVSELTGWEFRNPQSAFGNSSYPAYDLYPALDSVCITTSRGCPFRCTYCASNFLSPGFARRDPLRVLDEIEHWVIRHHVENIVFYDDALLIEPSKHIVPLLKELIARGIRCSFHTPNGLHVREINMELADIIFRAGFRTIRIGLETSNEETQTETGGKVDNLEFREAVENLKRAGYSGERIGVHIMVGLPGQRVEEVKESIAFVRENGAKPVLTEYSPVPHTDMFEKAKKGSSFDLEREPLFHNNSIFPCQWEGFTPADLRKLKENLKKE